MKYTLWELLILGPLAVAGPLVITGAIMLWKKVTGR